MAQSNDIFFYILGLITFPLHVLTNPELLKYYALCLFTIIIMYLVFATIYCSFFKISYMKFFKSTIFPIIGIFILIIQGIIYLFFVPYHIFITIKNTFHYFISIIKVIYKWIHKIIYTTLTIDDYILNNL